MASGNHGGRDLLACEAGADGEAVSERLGDGHDVRRHTRPFVGEKPPGAPHAALHLVEDQHEPGLVTDRAQALQELVARRIDTALALNRLDQDRGRLVADGGAGRREIAQVDLIEGIDGRLEPLEVLGLTAGGDGGERAPVEGVAEGDHAVALGRALARLVDARELERALHCLGAGIAEEHAVGEARGGELLGKAGLRRDLVEVGDVPELLGLGLQRRHHMRMRMAEAGHADAAAEVQVTLAVGRVEVRPFAPLESEVEAPIVGHQ